MAKWLDCRPALHANRTLSREPVFQPGFRLLFYPATKGSGSAPPSALARVAADPGFAGNYG